MKKRFILYICVISVICGFSQAAEPLPLSSVKYWCYQIQDLDSPGAVDAIVNSKYDMVVIDPMVTHDFGFDAKTMVNRIKASMASDGVHRKLVIAYIDIGQAEEWRWYWDGQTTYEENGTCKSSYVTQIQTWAPFVVACDPDGWGGNYPVAFWDNDWKDIVINGTNLGSGLGLYFDSMLDEVVQDGFDGIYLDWVEAWEMDAVQTRAQNEGKDPGREMLTFIRQMRTYGRQYNADFIVIQQNSSELINEVGSTDLKTAVDAIAQEGVWWDGDAIDDDWNNPAGFDQASCCTNYYLTRLRKYKNAGLPVFVADYAVQQADDVYSKASTEGFIAYATRRPLNNLTTTPPSFSTTQPPPGGPPFGSFDTPIHGTTVRSSVAVTGWALDDSGIQSVKIYLLNDDGQSMTLIDNAVLIEGARPDVASAYPNYPGNTKAGWGYMMLTHFLPGQGNGTYTFRAVATPTSGQSTTIGSTTVTIDNANAIKPFGALDTPRQGQTISGSRFVVWGWVLTPQPNAIPTDGSTIKVLIDGKYVGNVTTYGLYRPDIARYFPGYVNTDTASGYFILDTTAYSNGVHTIQWTAADNAGNTDGIGSRFFTISN